MDAAVKLELLTDENIDAVRAIHREDIPESWVDNADTIMELTQYGLEHNYIVHTYAVKYNDAYVGVILLGEAIPWETDPEEMNGVLFYRLMGFVIDNRYRSRGIGSFVLERAIKTIYDEYGVRPIALGVHKDNRGAASFYMNRGFRKTDAMEGNDYYYLRYPKHPEDIGMKQVKITAIRKTCYPDLMEKYENPIAHACDVEEGTVWISVDGEKPEGLCDSAWDSMSAFVRTLAEGGGDFYGGWMKNPHSAMISCNDGFRPVSFYMEALDHDIM